MMHIVLQDRRPSLASRLAALALAGLLGLVAAPALALQGMPTAPQKLPTTQLGIGMHVIKAEVAQTPREHAIGLMWRTEMGANEGMLFIFPQATKQCFWMKNTLIPLSIAFVDDDGKIVNIDEMQPQTEGTHCSAQPVRYVLEMNKGWFAKRHIQAGQKLSGAPFSPPR